MKKELDIYEVIGNEDKEVTEVENELKEYGTLVRDDEGIDDGCNSNCTDDYIMYRSYTLTKPNGTKYEFKLYYGDNSQIVFDCLEYE